MIITLVFTRKYKLYLKVNNLKKRFVFLIVLIVICIDQIIKNIVIHYNKIDYVLNSGGAFGLLENDGIVITIFNVLLIACFVFFMLKYYAKLENILKVSFALIIGGGTGNLLDRMFRGNVIDYIDRNKIVKYPLFNIADICIVIGIFLVILYFIKKTIKEQEKV